MPKTIQPIVRDGYNYAIRSSTGILEKCKNIKVLSKDREIYLLESENGSKYIYKRYQDSVFSEYKRNLFIINELLLQNLYAFLSGGNAQKVYLVKENEKPQLLIEYIENLNSIVESPFHITREGIEKYKLKNGDIVDIKEAVKPSNQGQELPTKMTDGSINNMDEMFAMLLVVLQLDPHMDNITYVDNTAKKIDNEMCLFWKLNNAADFSHFFLHNLYYYFLEDGVLKDLSSWLLRKDLADALWNLGQKVLDNKAKIIEDFQSAIATILSDKDLCSHLLVKDGKTYIVYEVAKNMPDGNPILETQEVALDAETLYQILENNAKYMQQLAEAICQYKGLSGYEPKYDQVEIANTIDILKLFNYEFLENNSNKIIENQNAILLKERRIQQLKTITKGEIAIFTVSSVLLSTGTAFIIAHEAINKFIEEKIIAFSQDVINKYAAQAIALLCFVSSITLTAIVLVPKIPVIKLNAEIKFLETERDEARGWVNRFDEEWNYICYAV